MFDPEDSDDGKLRELRADFEACIDHQADAQTEAHRASRFYHNTNNEGQWESDDLEYLRSQGRPAFTFNVIKSTVDTFIGQLRDQQRTAKVEPVGGEDAFVAEILNNVCERVEDMLEMDSMESDLLKDGVVQREASLRIHAGVDPENPAHVKVDLTPIPCYELHYDPASMRRDRVDARYLFWDKWLSRSEFKRLYPDADFDEVTKRGDSEGSGDGLSPDWSETGGGTGTGSDDLYESGRFERYYYNRKRNKVRVIHAEYRIPQKVWFLRDIQTGISEEVSKEIAENLPKYQDLGMLPTTLASSSSWRDRVYTVQFAGPEILFDDWLDEPYDGFSIVTFTYAVDKETGASYGMIRNLFDPQMEVNKAHSQSLENLVGQSKPGMIVEKGAVKDVKQFEDQTRTVGGVAIVEQGALTEGKIMERAVAQMSPAVSERLQNSLAMIPKISNVMTDDGGPAAQAEAAATVQLRYRKSLISMSDVTDAWEATQRGIKRRLVQIIVRAMPDSQIAEYLGNGDKYQVQSGPDGMVVAEIDAQTGQPKQMAQLDKLRTMKFDVRLEVSSDNTTLRLMEGQGLLSLAQMGVPVSPKVLYSKLVSSRSEREQLTEYAESAQRSQSESAQAEQQALQQQIAQTLQIEAGKVQETARHNQATEQLQMQKQVGDQSIDMAQVMANVDENERRAVVEVFKVIQQRQTQRASILASARRV